MPDSPPAFSLRRAGLGAALSDVSLELGADGRCALLGPAGAGKSALVALLAGLCPPDSGELELAGRPAAGLAPHRRGVALVLPADGPLPGRSVAASVAFAAATPAAAAEALAAFGMTDLAARRAGALSPVQAVRAALARAAAVRPALLLLDEPFAGLDAGEMDAVFADLRAWCDAHPCAVLLATRHPAQAFALGGAIALLAAGRLVQYGPAQSLYDAPGSALAARLLGPVNLLAGRIAAIEDDLAIVRLACGLEVEAAAGESVPGQSCLVAIRPERIALAAGSVAEMGPGALPARLRSLAPQGAQVRLELDLGDPPVPLTVLRPAGAPRLGLAPGEAAAIAWQPWDARILPPGPG